MNEPLYTISKSSFMKYEQCEKAFFLNKYHANLKDKLSIEKQLNFSRGHLVGKLAQSLFSNGIDVSEKTPNLQQATLLTKELIEQQQPVIYEATFVFNQVLVMVDILVLTDTGYEAYEVKSSLKISSTYIKDACLQYYVLKNCLNTKLDFYLVCLNDHYKLNGSLDVKQLFKKRDVTKTAETNLSYFSTQVEQALLTLKQSEVPTKKTGLHCLSPYTCDFYNYCWHSVLQSQKPTVFALSRAGRNRLMDWYEQGFVHLENLPDTVLEDDLMLQQHKQALLSGEEIVELNGLKELLGSINSDTICALDIEVYAPAIPAYQGKHPFEQTPFLIALVNQNRETSYFFKPFEDENLEAFAKALIELTKDYNHVIVFDNSLENRVIDELKETTSFKNELELLQAKMVDLNAINHSLIYFNPHFKSGTGLKTIAQVLFPEHDFSKLAIQDGLQAMHLYGDLKTESDLFKHEEIKQNLIEYCQNDSLVTLLFFNYLAAKIKSAPVISAIE
jgi:hypothetical protein